MKKSLLAAVLAVSVLAGSAGDAMAAKSIESISYLFAGNTSIYTHNVGRTKENLTSVCPDYFEVSSRGTLIKTREPDPLFIETMHASGVRVVPFVSNHWVAEAGRAATQNAELIGAQLSLWMAQYGFDGVDIDIENLNHNDREAFTAFMRTLRRCLPKGAYLSVCVAPNPWGISKGWQGQYDMAALADICDTVFLMAYDDHYDGDANPGAVAGLPFVEKSVVQALKTVPASKLVLGVPFYGRYWIKGNATGGKALTVSDIGNLTARYESTVWYDGVQHCARASMVIKPSDVSQGLWGGKKLAAGTYDIWYENDASIEKKLSLIKKYNLKGAGSWALGQEPETLWKGYRKWLYGLPFNDIESHWAEPAIARVHNLGIVSGTGGDTFSPNENLTRAQACVLLCKMLDIKPMESAPYVPADIQGHWAEGYMLSAIYRRLFEGYPDGTYRPSEPVTRQEMAALIEKTLHLPETIDFNQKLFTDVNPQSWSNRAIITLAVYNVVSGYTDGSFRPLDTVLRAEAVSMIDKIAELPKKDFPMASLFEDPPQIVEPR